MRWFNPILYDCVMTQLQTTRKGVVVSVMSV